MSLLRQFFLGWAVGLAGVLLAAGVDERFAVLFGVAGVLLLSAAVRGLTNDRVWAGFLAHRPGGIGYPRGQTARLVFGGVVFMLGTGWTFGGLVGLLVLLGVEGSAR